VSKNWASIANEDELLTKIERMEEELAEKFGHQKMEDMEVR
jgi:hypothetical protein